MQLQPMTYRRATPTDVDHIVELRERFKTNDGFDVCSTMERLPVQATIDAAIDDALAWIALDEHELVGYAMARTWQEDTGPRMYIIDGYIAPTRRGRGIGTELLVRLERAAQAHATHHGHGSQCTFGANTSPTLPGSAELLTYHGYEYVFSQIEMRLELAHPASRVRSRQPDGLRCATVEDATALARLTERVWAGRPFFTAPTSDSFARWIARSDLDLFSVLEHEPGAIVGFVAATMHPTHAHVEDLQVDPAQQRRGLGTALIQHVLTQLRSRGVREVRLNTEGHDPAGARALYEHLGFEVHRSYGRYRKPMFDTGGGEPDTLS